MATLQAQENTHDVAAVGRAGDSDEFYREQGSLPEDRGLSLLRFLCEQGGQPLALGRRDGRHASLRGLQLGKGRLQSLRDTTPGVSACLSATSGGVDLKDADLSGADLAGADLSGADLRRANLAGAFLEQANLSGALLEEACLDGADLAGADLRFAQLSNASLSGALLEDAQCNEASMRFAALRGSVLEGADLRGADLWSADLERANLTRADARGVRLTEVNLKEADLSGADLREAWLCDCTLAGALMHDADLTDATLKRSDLRGADLREADCIGVDLTNCEIEGVRLSDCWLERTRLHVHQLNGTVGEERARDYAAAELAYSALERNFSGLNDRAGAVWAYLRRRRMQKLSARQRAHVHWSAGRRAHAMRAYLKFVIDQLTEWLCDYGESVPRVLGSLAFLFLTFTALYAITGSVLRQAPDSENGVTYNLLSVALFSFLSMTSGAPSGVLSPRHDLALMLTGLHLFLGVALTGLLGFVLGNRIRR